MMTSSIAENIIIVWITSVHTTAFKPPCEAEEEEEVSYSVCPGLVVYVVVLGTYHTRVEDADNTHNWRN